MVRAAVRPPGHLAPKRLPARLPQALSCPPPPSVTLKISTLKTHKQTCLLIAEVCSPGSVISHANYRLATQTGRAAMVTRFMSPNTSVCPRRPFQVTDGLAVNSCLAAGSIRDSNSSASAVPPHPRRFSSQEGALGGGGIGRRCRRGRDTARGRRLRHVAQCPRRKPHAHAKCSAWCAEETPSATRQTAAVKAACGHAAPCTTARQENGIERRGR